MIGNVLSWGVVALGIYVLASGAALALFALLARIRGSRSILSSRGELAEAPQDLAMSREEIRDALDRALSLPGVVNTRLEAIARDELRDLRRLPQQLQGYYVVEVDW